MALKRAHRVERALQAGFLPGIVWMRTMTVFMSRLLEAMRLESAPAGALAQCAL